MIMVIQKWTRPLLLVIVCGMMILIHGVVYAEKSAQKAVTLEQVIEIALKDNWEIQLSKQDKRASVLSNKIADFKLWAPKADLIFAHENRWQGKDKTFYLKSAPIFKLTWGLNALFDKVFKTKIHCSQNVIADLVAVKAVAKALQEVVTCYYELALAQKKWDISNSFTKIASARLKTEQEKFKLGIVSKIDLLNADLALKQAKLTVLEQQEMLKEKRRNLNLVLNKSLDEEIRVESAISVKPIWDIAAITKEKVVDLETEIQEKKVGIAATELSRVKASPLSCLSLYGSIASQGYTYNLEKEKSSITQHSQSLGWGVSLDLGELLLLPAEIKRAKIALDKEKFTLTKEKLVAEGKLETKRWKYRHAIGLHKMVEGQLKVSKQKLVFIKEQYRLNQVKLLDLQEAQQDMQKAEISLIEYAFKVKQAEFELYQLIGMFHK